MRTTSYLGLLLGLAVVVLAARAGDDDGAILARGLPWGLVLGGTMASAVLGSSLPAARQTLAALSRLFVTGTVSAREATAALVELARQARANGPATIDPEAVSPRDPILVKGLQLVVERVEPERIEELLRRESERLSGQLAQAAGLLRLMGRAAALLGVAFTLLALAQLPSGPLGLSASWPGIAAALGAGCDGLLLAGLLLLPLAARVRTLDRHERLVRELMLRGLLAIRLGQNPDFVRDALADLARPSG